MKKQFKNVLTEVVKNDKCCGCGVCAGMAENCLSMHFNRQGEFIPALQNCSDCGRCLSVCPFSASLDQGEEDSPIGKYLKCYAGYSRTAHERSNGSSGGLATRVLKTLLETKKVTRAVVVAPSHRPDRFFEARIVSSADEIDHAAGSKYYPIEFSSVLQAIKTSPETFALIGLPCVLKSIRLIQKTNPEVGHKIKYLLGLACVNNLNRHFTSAVLGILGVKNNNVQAINYRLKDNGPRAYNFKFETVSREGRRKKIGFAENPFIRSLSFADHFFTLKACFQCPDFFADHSDISFMDAWLKPYDDDPKGTSMVIARTSEMQDLIEDEMKRGRVSLKEIPAADVLSAQGNGLAFKKKIHPERRIRKMGIGLNRWLAKTLYFFETIGAVLGPFVLRFYFNLLQASRCFRRSFKG